VKSIETLLLKLQRKKNLPSLPQVLLKLIDVCNNEDTPIRELSQIASKDPSLASKILRLANSSYAGFMEPVTSLEKAVVYLGAETIKNLAISASVLQAFSSTKSDAVFNLKHFWWHSFLCACLSRRMAEQAGIDNTEEAFLCGLLHDIGKLIFRQYFPKEYGQILSEVGSDPIRLTEREAALGANHAELGAWLIRRWQLDPFMADAVAYHHETVGEIENAFPLVRIVYAANLLSQQTAGDGAAQGAAVAKGTFGLSDAQMEALLSGAREEVMEVAEALDIPVAPPPREASDAASIADDALTKEIKIISLLYGTLENLLKADCKESILLVVERGLKIVFDVDRLFFFLYDPKGNRLVGTASESRWGRSRIRDLFLYVSPPASLPAKSLVEQTPVDSFNHPTLSIADKQLIHLLETEGMLCIPLLAYHQGVGVIVMGIQSAQTPKVAAQQKLLQMFANHAAVCLYIEEFKRQQTQKIQDERMEASSLIARKVVHEVNNPLGIIKNYLKILGLKLPERHPAQEDIGVIGKEIDRVVQILRRMNRFSQTESRTHLPVDVNRLLAEQITLLRKTILTPAGIRDHLSLKNDLPSVAGDANSLKQVFLNLIKNAAEAMPHGGNLHIWTDYIEETPFGLVTGSETRGRVEITIKDDGPGIPEDIRSRLFEPFISSKGADHRGLGLSIVHSIIKEHNGTISCETDSQMGTCFVISLPLSSIEKT